MAGLREPAMLANEEDGLDWSSSDDSAYEIARSPRHSSRGFLIGAVFLTACAALFFCHFRYSAAGTVADMSSSMEEDEVSGECADAFKQCGGLKFTGAKCCKLGCSCEKQSAYFWGCKADGGLDHCSLKAGSGQFEKQAIAETKKLVLNAQAAHDAYEKAAKAQAKTLITAHQLLMDSQKALDITDDEDKDEFASALSKQLQATKSVREAGIQATKAEHAAVIANKARVDTSSKVLKYLKKGKPMLKRLGGGSSTADEFTESAASETSESSDSGAKDNEMDEIQKLKEQLEALKKNSKKQESSASGESASDNDDDGGASFEVISAE